MLTTRPRLVVAFARVPAHDLLRAEAADFHGVPVQEIVLSHSCPRCGSDEHGRPVLEPTSTVPDPASVSLSRAGTLAIVALTDLGQVGVDVETAGAADFAGFDDVALHPDETATADRALVWARKEALLKAYGLGLAVDPASVRLEADGIAAWPSSHERPHTVRWQDVALLGYAAAVVVLPHPDRDAAELEVTVRGSVL